MKQFSIYLLIIVASISCRSFFDPNSQIDTSPAICQQAMKDGSLIYGDKVKEHSIEELLTLQKCGLAVHPNWLLNDTIADHEDYPVPEIIKRFRTDDNESYQYQLIINIVELTKSERHKSKLLADKDMIINQVSKTISSMQNKNIRNNSEKRFEEIKEFFAKNNFDNLKNV